MNKTEAIVDTFYKSFALRDYKTMQSFYHEDATFSDPVFNVLKSNQLKAMWHMLCERGKDLTITHGTIGYFDNSARVTWKATYTFSKTGRIVHNEIDARFFFKDDKIIQHFDNFDLWKWMRMALGTPGLILGWSGFMQEKVQTEARKGLDSFIKKHSEYI
ncbi:MAG: nuclear transport factor 2 family protein [Calditrichae bacterium]|nr:nuclear transport factor 2 family protein [Calditrichota bacterium]MCB9059340.1 nuclear transport factor 2 family protein [Calditrichia bacterium]